MLLEHLFEMEKMKHAGIFERHLDVKHTVCVLSRRTGGI